MFAEVNTFSYMVMTLLGRQLLYATVLFVLIAALARVFRIRSPYWHVGLWALLLLRLVLPPDLSNPISGRNLLDRVMPLDNTYERIFSVFSPPKVITTSLATSNPTRTSGKAEHSPSVPTILLACWVLGMFGCLELYWRKRARYRRLIQQAMPVRDAALNTLIHDCCVQFGITRPVQVVSSDRHVSPFTFGVLRPKIYLPKSLVESGDMTALYAIIAHEIVHIKRHDTIWMSLQSMVQIVYFFFPVTWYANRQIEVARECICDRAVVSGGKISNTRYGASLLMVLKFCLTEQVHIEFSPSFNAQYHNLKRRIQHLKAYSPMRHPRKKLMYASLLLFGFLTLPMARETMDIRFFTPFQEPERHVYRTVEQRMIQSYSEPYSTTLSEMKYTGIGLQGEFGEAVYAIGAGQVIHISGKFPHAEVVIAHQMPRRKTIYSVYARIHEVQVQVGDQVTEETQIGRLFTHEEYHQSGLTQHSLHLEVRKNPEAYRSRSPHYLKYETSEILQIGFLNPLVFYQQHLQS
jgi:beta-lactamase regulating signal transducer with metallopeptidase domain